MLVLRKYKKTLLHFKSIPGVVIYVLYFASFDLIVHPKNIRSILTGSNVQFPLKFYSDITSQNVFQFIETICRA